jgi:hypothetical protein
MFMYSSRGSAICKCLVRSVAYSNSDSYLIGWIFQLFVDSLSHFIHSFCTNAAPFSTHHATHISYADKVAVIATDYHRLLERQEERPPCCILPRFFMKTNGVFL